MPEALASFTKKLQGKHILIVDDDALFLHVLTDLITEYGIRVSYAQSGNKALYEIEQHTPNIILLDLELSDMEGLDLATLVRQNDQTKDVPILFMSGDIGQKARPKRASGRSDGFISEVLEHQ
jgi:chemosensory pili system protein ChpA (sensor histidine kinase/response regulator)